MDKEILKQAYEHFKGKVSFKLIGILFLVSSILICGYLFTKSNIIMAFSFITLLTGVWIAIFQTLIKANVLQIMIDGYQKPKDNQSKMVFAILFLCITATVGIELGMTILIIRDFIIPLF